MGLGGRIFYSLAGLEMANSVVVAERGVLGCAGPPLSFQPDGPPVRPKRPTSPLWEASAHPTRARHNDLPPQEPDESEGFEATMRHGAESEEESEGETESDSEGDENRDADGGAPPGTLCCFRD